MTFFGFTWLGWGLGQRAATTVSQWIAYDLAALALFAVSILTIRAGKLRMATAPVPTDDFWAHARTPYRNILMAEGIGCGIVVLLTLTFHRSDLLAFGISLVVGVHFIPLAMLFRIPAYTIAGIAMVLSDLLSLAIFRGDNITVAVGIASGTILWLTAAYALFRAHQTLKYSTAG